MSQNPFGKEFINSFKVRQAGWSVPITTQQKLALEQAMEGVNWNEDLVDFFRWLGEILIERELTKEEPGTARPYTLHVKVQVADE